MTGLRRRSGIRATRVWLRLTVWLFASSGMGLVAAPLLVAPSAAAAEQELEAGGTGSEVAPTDASSGALDNRQRLRRALDAYSAALAESDRDARLAGFARAERGFASLVADGVETAALFTNLGNAALQAQHPGRAVLAYHRALALEPDASTARQNLAHVRSRLPAWVPRRDAGEGAQRLLFYRQIDPETRATVAAICFAAMAGCVGLAVRRREGAFRGLAIAFGLAWASGIVSLVYDAQAGRDDLAVVIADDVPARSADSTLSPLALPEPLPAGVEVEILEERGGWARVRLANGRDVWIRGSAVERVRG
jgi:tetratricopeptide (TPR) repeat protein